MLALLAASARLKASPRSTVVIDARGRGDWMVNSTSNPMLIAPTIFIELGQDAISLASFHVTGKATIMNSPCISSLTVRNRDIRAAYRSARSDRNIRSITAFALRQIIRWADERTWSSRKCRSGLRKVCIDICRPLSVPGSQHQIVLASDTRILSNWGRGRCGRCRAPAPAPSESDCHAHKDNSRKRRVLSHLLRNCLLGSFFDRGLAGVRRY